MPPSITSLVNNLPTIEETMSAKQLWNRSLPIAANVGIIEYNRVDGKTFKEKVGEKYGEGWWRRLEDLAAGLNEAAGVIKGKGQELEGKTLDDGPRKGKEYEMKMVELTEGEGYEPEMKNLNETPGKAKESEITTRDHLAEAAVTIGGNSNTKTTNPTTRKTQEAPIKPGDETTEATLSLLSLSETPAGANPTNNPSALATSNTLSALWYLIDRFFSSGHEAASYFLVALEAAIRHDKPVVHPLHIPAPPAFWTDAADWQKPKVGMTLILTLAASEKTMFDAFARFTKSLGAPALKAEAMQKVKSASLRKAVLRAKDDAANKQRTTVLGVNLRDVHHSQLCERYGKDFEERFATFARMFVLGICPDGAKLWLVGGPWGETGTVWESNSKAGAAVGTWEEMDEFVRDFEGFAVPDVRPFPPPPPFRSYWMGWE